MYHEKLVRLTETQHEELDCVKNVIKKNGGYVSCNQLIRDSLQIFLENYQEIAIKKYSPHYELKKECCNHDCERY